MDQIIAEIEAAGVPYVLEDGGKHIKIRIAGRMVGIYPKGKHARSTADHRAMLNLRAQVRRVIREVGNA